MILKLKLTNETFGIGWKFIDGVSRINSYKVTQKPQVQTVVHILNTPDAQKDAESVAFECLFIDCMKNGEDYPIYTELPAFLLNDKGETIERLN